MWCPTCKSIYYGLASRVTFFTQKMEICLFMCKLLVLLVERKVKKNYEECGRRKLVKKCTERIRYHHRSYMDVGGQRYEEKKMFSEISLLNCCNTVMCTAGAVHDGRRPGQGRVQRGEPDEEAHKPGKHTYSLHTYVTLLLLGGLWAKIPVGLRFEKNSLVTYWISIMKIR